jgi:hypothetical protein
MSPAQRLVIDRHCTPEWAAKVIGPWTDFEEAGRGKIAAEPGHEIDKLTPEQLAAWRVAVAPLTERWAAKVENGDAVLADLKAALKKHDALAE